MRIRSFFQFFEKVIGTVEKKTTDQDFPGLTFHLYGDIGDYN